MDCPKWAYFGAKKVDELTLINQQIAQWEQIIADVRREEGTDCCRIEWTNEGLAREEECLDFLVELNRKKIDWLTGRDKLELQTQVTGETIEVLTIKEKVEYLEKQAKEYLSQSNDWFENYGEDNENAQDFLQKYHETQNAINGIIIGEPNIKYVDKVVTKVEYKDREVVKEVPVDRVVKEVHEYSSSDSFTTAVAWILSLSAIGIAGTNYLGIIKIAVSWVGF